MLVLWKELAILLLSLTSGIQENLNKLIDFSDFPFSYSMLIKITVCLISLGLYPDTISLCQGSSILQVESPGGGP